MHIFLRFPRRCLGGYILQGVEKPEGAQKVAARRSVEGDLMPMNNR
jgi:hypothetical protein